MSGPLDKIRVVECTSWLQGPFAGAILGDLGADVIKVEDPLHGDGLRGLVRPDLPATPDSTTKAQDVGSSIKFPFEYCNRNKRGITLNLSKEKGREVLYKLIERSDVFLTSFRESAIDKIGLTCEIISKYNPRIVYAKVSGWGTKGPLSGESAFEFVVASRSGMAHQLAPRGDPPIMLPAGFGDVIGGISAALSIIAALVARERKGIGQMVDSSLLGSLINVGTHYFHSLILGGEEFPRRYRPAMPNPLWNHYRCKDGKWLTLAMLQADRYWRNFCEAVGIEYLEKDPKFDNILTRAEHAEELISILDMVFASKTRDEWMNILKEKGELICAPVLSVPEAVNDPQVIANEYITDFNHPIYGPINYVAFPGKFSKTPALIRRPAPEFGQHTEEVLMEVLGYTWEELAQLRDEQIF